MNREKTVRDYRAVIDARRWDDLRGYFSGSALVFWPNSGECFDIDRFVEINRRYPGKWTATVKRLVEADDALVTAVQVADGQKSFHAVSFFEFQSETDKIARLEEYWGEDSLPPEWRREI